MCVYALPRAAFQCFRSAAIRLRRGKKSVPSSNRRFYVSVNRIINRAPPFEKALRLFAETYRLPTPALIKIIWKSADNPQLLNALFVLMGPTQTTSPFDTSSTLSLKPIVSIVSIYFLMRLCVYVSYTRNCLRHSHSFIKSIHVRTKIWSGNSTKVSLYIQGRLTWNPIRLPQF